MDSPSSMAGTGAMLGAAGNGVAGSTQSNAGASSAGNNALAGSTSVPPGAGTGALGMAGMAGMTSEAGSTAAGSGGTTAMAGSGGSGPDVVVDGDKIIRGDDPSMSTVMANGPYAFETYADGFRPGVEFLAGTIYYPTDAEPPFAGVVICPGFTAFQDSVAPWGPFLASHGIVLMTIDTITNLDSVNIRQGALMDALDSLKGEHSRSGSPLMGKLHMSRFGLMGWSMGGGATWLNANEHPELKTGISLAGHNATAGGAGLLTNVTVPILMLAGAQDTGILGLAMSQPVYDVIPESTPKMLYEAASATHFDISPESGEGWFGVFGLSWQKVFLEGDERYRQFLLLPQPPGASDFRTNVK